MTFRNGRSAALATVLIAGLAASACAPIRDRQGYLMDQVLVASVRNPMHIIESAKMGADVATCPPSVIMQLFNHPLTDKGLAAFVADWKATGQSIL